MNEPKQVNILGVPINMVTEAEALRIFDALLKAENQYQVATVNPEFIMTAQSDVEDMEVLQKTTLNMADGGGVLWASTFLSLPPKNTLGTYVQLIQTALALMVRPDSMKRVLPEKIRGVDVIRKLCQLAASLRLPVYLLGGPSKSNSGAIEFLKTNIPGLTVTGEWGGERPIEDSEKLIESINSSGAGVLIVCFGHPKQEKWIYKNLKHMPSVRIAIGAGGTFDYWSGTQKTPPSVIKKINLEWLWRLFTQKGRFKKIYISTFLFTRAVLKAKLINSRHELRNRH